MTPPLRKRLKRRLRTAVLVAAFAVLRLLPLGAALWLGRQVGRLAFRVAGRPRRLALAHLRVAFPDATDAFIADTAKESFIRLGEHLLENVVVHRIDGRLTEWVALPDDARAVVDEALAGGKGAVLVSGHIGNWELAARALVAHGYAVTGVARELHDPGLLGLTEAFRREGGVTMLYRGRPATPMVILRHLRRGGILVVLADQDTRTESVFAPFFGIPAKTPRGPADLALRLEVPLLAGFIHRTGPGKGHRLGVRRIDGEDDALALTTAINEAVEAELRAHPADWVWFHRRWRTAAGAQKV